MRSIRLSLVVYFLVLLAVALGAISVLVYRTTEQSVRDKQRVMADLLKKKHQDKLDEMLLQEARTLANFVKFQAESRNPRYVILQYLGVSETLINPSPHLVMPLWALERVRGPVREHLWRMGFTLKIKEMVLPPEQEGQFTQFLQINGAHGAEWHSDSMGGRSLPFDPGTFKGTNLVDWRFDDTHLDGMPVRRVVLKVAHFRIDFPPPPAFRPKGPPFRGWPGPRGGPGFKSGPETPEAQAARDTPGPRIGPEPAEPPGPNKGTPGPRMKVLVRNAFPPLPPPTIYIQGAYDKTRTDGLPGRMERELAQDLDGLQQTSDDSLASLGRYLLLLNGLTFATALLGVFVLVWLGLAPLQKLSDAVSRVSAKDFRLPLDEKRMPAELRPIVGRLEETLDLLKRAFAREKHAAADISHELRTPLAALLTTLEVALRKPRSAEEYREVLEDARASGQHMYGLVERLLTLARLDAGADHLRPREVDVKSLAEQCASLVRPLAEARGLSLTVHADGPACVTADPDKLREVFTNLLHNAIEYNRPDGTIDVAVERDNGDVRVDVKDTGIGIAPDARQLIFERFYRSDPSRAAEGLHAGLGLAIVKGYVDLMGGKIDVESTVGQGSTFRLRLPVQAAGAHN
jgi:heavy metal sensor kinase